MKTRTLWGIAALSLGLLGGNVGRAQQVQNLLPNGGFETGAVSPWTTYGTVSKEVVTTLTGATIPENPVEGRYCLHVTVPKAGVKSGDIGLWTPQVTLAKGKKYTFSVFLKSKTASLQLDFAPILAVSPWTAYGPYQNVTISNTWA